MVWPIRKRPGDDAPRLGLRAVGLLVAILTGCETSSPYGTAPGDDPTSRLEALVESDIRVGRVGHRLAISNADLCPSTALLAGWSLHAASLYGVEVKPVATGRFGLSGDLPGVLYVVPDGPAARAGVQVSDLIISVAGAELDSGPDRREAAYEGFAANLDVINASLSRGRTPLRIRRGQNIITLTLEPERGCSYGFQVDPSSDYYARADGQMVFISSALAAYAADDDDLAVILGHELAHAALNHPSQRRGLGGLPWRTEEREREADRTGLYLAARAGYDPLHGPAFWRRFGADHWQARYAQWGHPSAETRARALDSTAAEIISSQANGQVVRP